MSPVRATRLRPTATASALLVSKLIGKIVSLAHDVTDPGYANDRGPHGLKGSNVPIDRPLRDFQLLGNFPRKKRPARLTKKLNDFKESGGLAHASLRLFRQAIKPPLTIGWQQPSGIPRTVRTRERGMAQQTHMTLSRNAGAALVVVSAVVFSTAGSFTNGVAADAWGVIFWRGLAAAGFTFAYLAMTGALVAEIRCFGLPAILATVLMAMGTAAFIPAFKLSSVANVVLIYASAPFFAAGLSWIVVGEAPSRRSSSQALPRLAVFWSLLPDLSEPRICWVTGSPW